MRRNGHRVCERPCVRWGGKGNSALCEGLRWVTWLGFAGSPLTASAEQHAPERQSVRSEEGLASCGISLSHISPCKNHKALNPHLVRRGGGGVVQAVVVRGVRHSRAARSQQVDV